MKTISAIWKNNKIYIIIAVLCLCIGAVIGFKVGSPQYIGKGQTNSSTNYANNTIPAMPSLISLTNTITNRLTLSNIVWTFFDDSNRRAAPFINNQVFDIMNVTKYDQSESIKIKPFTENKKWSIGAIGLIDCQGPAIGPILGYSGDWWKVNVGAFYGSISNFGGTASAEIRF